MATRPKLTAWPHATVDLGLTPMGPISLKMGSAAPATPLLDAITVHELASGWDSAVVAKANVVRSASRTVWASTRGFTVGTRPDTRLIGSGFQSILSGLGVGVRADITKKWGSPIAKNPSYIAAQTLMGFGNPKLATVTTDAALAREYLIELLGFDPGPPTTYNVVTGLSHTVYHFGSDVKGRVVTGKTLYAFSVARMDGGSGTLDLCCYYADPLDGCEGLRSVYFGPTYYNSSINMATTGGETVLQHVNMDPGFQSVVSLFRTDLPISPFPATAQSYTPVLTGSAIVNGFTTSRLAKVTRYLIGGIAHYDSLSAIGPTTYAGEDVTVDSNGIGFSWKGNLISQTFAGTPGDKAVLDNTVFKTFVSKNVRVLSKVPNSLLDSLNFFAELRAVQAVNYDDFSMYTDSNSAQVTFAAAERRALGQNATLVHQVAVATSSASISQVVASGTLGALTFEAFDMSGVTKAATKAEMVEALMRGAAATSTVAGSSVAAVFMAGLSVDLALMQDPLLAAFGRTAGVFDEAGAFPNTVCDYESLGPSEQAAFLLTQFAMSRASMSSFAVTCIQEGRRVVKALF